jgi:hypothetical protein
MATKFCKKTMTDLRLSWRFGAGIFFKILAHPVFKMWILQEPKKIALWNKGILKRKNTEKVQHV